MELELRIYHSTAQSMCLEKIVA